MSFFQDVYEIVKKIPYGKVATYGQIAIMTGKPKNARIVGYALHKNPEPNVIPCHRVIFADGSVSDGFAFGGPDVQYQLLLNEGITFNEFGKVIMDLHRWNGD